MFICGKHDVEKARESTQTQNQKSLCGTSTAMQLLCTTATNEASAGVQPALAIKNKKKTKIKKIK